MSIRSINYNINSSVGAYSQKLTPATKNKLDELGISYNANTTEAEGKALIQSAIKRNNQKEDKSELFQNNSTKSNSLLDRAISLARQLGITDTEGVELKQLLVLIEQKLEQKIAVNSNNLDEIKKLREFSSELASIQAQSNGSSGYDSTNQALMMSLEVLSQYNKNFIRR